MQEDNVLTLAIKEAQFINIKAEEFKTKKFFFKGLCECIGVVIRMKNKDTFAHHKTFDDSAINFKKELKKIKEDDIEKIELFGGHINSLFYPSQGNKILTKTFNYKNKIIKIEEDFHDFNKKKQIF